MLWGEASKRRDEHPGWEQKDSCGLRELELQSSRTQMYERRSLEARECV